MSSERRDASAPLPAAEVQQNLFPPRIARIAGAQLAGALMPSYEVGGDWFDFVENRDGAWLAIADASGNGPTAAGLGAAALGALRAARRDGSDLQQALCLMHETVRKLDHPDFYVTALVARWRAATSTLTWVNCGHPPAYLVDVDGNLSQLQSPSHPALGTGENTPSFKPTERRLNPGERLILLTDGITARHMAGGETFGVAGLERARERRGTRPRPAPRWRSNEPSPLSRAAELSSSVVARRRHAPSRQAQQESTR